jgi:hypothetical protein
MAFEDVVAPVAQQTGIFKSESTPFDDKFLNKVQEGPKFGTGAKGNITSLEKNQNLKNEVSGIVQKFK